MPKKDIIIVGIVGVVILIAGYLSTHFYQPKFEIGVVNENINSSIPLNEEQIKDIKYIDSIINDYKKSKVILNSGLSKEYKEKIKELNELLLDNINEFVLCKSMGKLIPCSSVVQNIINNTQQNVSQVQPQVNP